MYDKKELLFSLFMLLVFASGAKIQEYAVDTGRNLTLPCPTVHDKDVMWLKEGKEDQIVPRWTFQDDGSLFLLEVDRNDSGIYACSPANTVSDDLKSRMNVTVRTPPPALANVSVHPSTILALILWEVKATGGYPIIDFTAQYRLAYSDEDWKPITPNHISPNSRQIDVYKLEPNTSYSFRIWATNQLGRGDISEVVAKTLEVYHEKELARRFLAGADKFDTRIWVVAVSVVMGTLILLGLGTCFLLYQECRVPGAIEEQEIIELVPNIILNPGFEGNSHTEQIPADENSNSENTIRLNNNTVVQPRNM